MNHACCFLKISFPRVFYSLIIVCLRVSVLLFTQCASCWAFWIYGFISFISFVNSAWSIQIASFLHFLCLSYLQFSSDLCGTPLCPPCLIVFVLFISLQRLRWNTNFNSASVLSRSVFVTPWTVARQAPLSMGILQARTLEWVTMPSSRGSS